jgi:hypothetical protein
MYHIHDTFNKMHSTARAPRHDIARLLHAKLADAANTTRGRGSGFIADDENLKTTITRLQQNHLNLKCDTHPTSSLSRFHCKGSHVPAGWRQSSPRLAKITKKCRRTRARAKKREMSDRTRDPNARSPWFSTRKPRPVCARRPVARGCARSDRYRSLRANAVRRQNDAEMRGGRTSVRCTTSVTRADAWEVRVGS